MTQFHSTSCSRHIAEHDCASQHITAHFYCQQYVRKPWNYFFFLSSDVNELTESVHLSSLLFPPSYFKIEDCFLGTGECRPLAVYISRHRPGFWQECRQSHALVNTKQILGFLKTIQADKLTVLHLLDVKLMKVGQKPLMFARRHNLTLRKCCGYRYAIMQMPQCVCMLHLLHYTLFIKFLLGAVAAVWNASL